MKAKPYWLLSIIITGLFCASLYSSLFYNKNEGLDVLKMKLENDPDFMFNIKIIFDSIRAPLFLLIPLLGLLFKNKIGWILIAQYFYFLVFNLFIGLFKNFQEFEYILFFIVIILFITTIIYFLNRESLCTNHFKIKRGHLLVLNSIALGIGVFFSISLFLYKYAYWIK
ncbi:hypothetical protein [Pontimicrobium sp. MEBiC06410]